jgi:Xaa-Pro dipeptidase
MLSSNPESLYRGRQRALAAYLEAQKLDAVLLVDLEEVRNRSVRYLCGHPQDALLIITAAGRSILIPWDLNLAERTAVSDQVVPYTDFGRDLNAAARTLLTGEKCTRIEVSEKLSYPRAAELINELAGLGIEAVCRRGGVDAHLLELRRCKEAAEIAALRRAGEISDAICGELPALLASGPLPEHEVAGFIERRARELGAEGLGFQILAAAPERSFAIHTFPNVTSALFGAPGLSLVDFGIRVEGYTSDATVTLIRGRTDALQERMVRAVEEAYALALELIRPGAFPMEVARAVDELFASRGFRMPHSLGHGIGLDTHEPPLLRASGGSPQGFEEDMVIALEPGLYDSRAGGVRWENDLLLVPGGTEPLTRTTILRLD